MPELHYLYDPLCGWCYAAEPLLDAACGTGMPIRLHGGGLFPRSASLPAETRKHIRVADRRISQMSGQLFGEAYLAGLLDDPATVYYSLPPIAAILAADTVKPGSAPAMLKAIQHAHFRDGHRVVETSVLTRLARQLGLDRARFAAAFSDATKNAVRPHIDETRQLMHATNVKGFPTFLLQKASQRLRVPHEQHYGDPKGFLRTLQGLA